VPSPSSQSSLTPGPITFGLHGGQTRDVGGQRAAGGDELGRIPLLITAAGGEGTAGLSHAQDDLAVSDGAEVDLNGGLVGAVPDHLEVEGKRESTGTLMGEAAGDLDRDAAFQPEGLAGCIIEAVSRE
jgi:hypothetical protein